MTSEYDVRDPRLTDRAAHGRRHPIQKKLVIQIAVGVLIGLSQLGLALSEIVRSDATTPNPLWILVALVIGFGFGHAIRVYWNSEASQVMLVGGQLLLTLVYVTVSLGARVVLTHALGLDSAGLLALLVASGLMLGHSLGLVGEIRRALTS